MIEENGIVVKVDGASAWVETQRKSACASCSANKGCGSAVLSNVLGRKRNIVKVAALHGLREGDRVLLGLEETALVKGSFAVYIVPLLFMFFCAGLGEFLSFSIGWRGNELFTVVFAFLGLVAGYFWLKLFAKRNQCNRMYHPVILNKE